DRSLWPRLRFGSAQDQLPLRAAARRSGDWDFSPRLTRFMLVLATAGLCIAQETYSGSAALDAAVEQAVHDGLIPGAVLVVGRDGKILHRKAYGARALIP